MSRISVCDEKKEIKRRGDKGVFISLGKLMVIALYWLHISLRDKLRLDVINRRLLFTEYELVKCACFISFARAGLLKCRKQMEIYLRL